MVGWLVIDHALRYAWSQSSGVPANSWVLWPPKRHQCCLEFPKTVVDFLPIHVVTVFLFAYLLQLATFDLRFNCIFIKKERLVYVLCMWRMCDMCMARVCRLLHATTHVWRSKDNSVESLLPVWESQGLNLASGWLWSCLPAGLSPRPSAVMSELPSHLHWIRFLCKTVLLPERIASFSFSASLRLILNKIGLTPPMRPCSDR